MRIYNATDEWSSEDDFDAIKIDVTDTSSNAQSKLLLLGVSGVPKFSIRKDGLVNAKSMVVEQDLRFGYTVKTDGQNILSTDKPIIFWEGSGFSITNNCIDAVTESGCNNIPNCIWTSGYDCGDFDEIECEDYFGCSVETDYCEDHTEETCPGSPCSLEEDTNSCHEFDGDEQACIDATECAWDFGYMTCTGTYNNGAYNCVGGAIGEFCDGGEIPESCEGAGGTNYNNVTITLPQPHPTYNEYSSIHFIKNFNLSTIYIKNVLNTNNNSVEDSYLLPYTQSSFFVHVGSGQWLALEFI